MGEPLRIALAQIILDTMGVFSKGAFVGSVGELLNKCVFSSDSP